MGHAPGLFAQVRGRFLKWRAPYTRKGSNAISGRSGDLYLSSSSCSYGS